LLVYDKIISWLLKIMWMIEESKNNKIMLVIIIVDIKYVLNLIEKVNISFDAKEVM